MKKQIQKIIGLLTVSSLLFMSCETVDFGDENLNPNAVSKANTGALITASLRSMPGILANSSAGILYVQHISEITYNDDSCYETIQWNFDGHYTGPLMNLQTVINLNTDDPDTYSSSGSAGMQKGVAHLLQVWFYHHLTDRWGAVPYSEALKGVDNLKPKFDSQQAIYTGMFAQIDAALAMLDGGGLEGDFMFNGDAAKWKKFGNTMKMVMALRLSDVDPATAQSKFLEAVSGGVLGSNADNIHYPYTTADNNDNPWQDRFQTRDDYASSDTMVEALIAKSDPRLHAYAAPVVTAGGGAGGSAKVPVKYTTVDGKIYGGMPYGVLTPGILQAWVSYLPHQVIYKSDATQSGMIFSYAQVCFSMAEAASKGWGVSGTAKAWYDAGIAASMSQWGISAADSATYVAAAAAAPAIGDIAYEKWVALYLQGYEAWAEWRRLDAPSLVVATDILNGTAIPVRHGYGARTASANKANHDAAVAAMGKSPGDFLQDVKVWWDTK